MLRSLAAFAALLMLAACGQAGNNIPGERSDHDPYGEIAADEVLRLVGTEPFWGGQLSGARLTYTTPDNPDGTEIAVARFAGRGGLSFSGTLDGADLVIAITAGTCSDGMSDRSYPFVATLRIGEETRMGCAFSDAHPFTDGPEPDA